MQLIIVVQSGWLYKFWRHVLDTSVAQSMAAAAVAGAAALALVIQQQELSSLATINLWLIAALKQQQTSAATVEVT